MRKKIFLLVLFCILVIGSQAQQQRLVEVRGELAKDSYLIAEPIYLRLRVINVSAKPQKFASVINPYGSLKIQILREGEFPEEYVGMFRPGLYPQTIFELDPGKEKGAYFLLLHKPESATGFLFDKPERVRLFVTLQYGVQEHYRTRETILDKIIEIQQPEGREKEVFQLLFTPEHAEALHGGAVKEKTQSLFRKIVDEYPDSVYAPHCLLALAQGYSTASTSDDDLKYAIGLFKEFMESYPELQFQDLCYYRIAFCYDKMGNEEMARHWLAELYYQFPDSYLIARDDPLYARYYFLQEEDITPPPSPHWMLFP